MKSPGGGIWGGLPVSLLLHLLAAAAVLHGMAPGPVRMPPVIDLSLLPPPRAGGPAALTRPATGSGRGPAGTPRTARAGRTLRPAEPAVDPSPAPPPAPSTATRGEIAPEGVPAASPSAAPSSAASLPASFFPGNVAGILSASSPRTPGPFAGTLGPGGNYGYLRDAIQREIAYPAVARKMGWEGRVVVAFVILPDGTVRDVRVLRGSGFPVLDRNAMEAVRSASPFPRPPAEAEVLTPVVYKLD